ncbi:FeS assembly SUF system regulator [Natronospira proteinivora]|uniref:FeS assembly SUF system regulator n=1 Tax=Natronospira proteinivora TaxID=1807133 RepID=A0ABT1G639_9GAMM|nr:SUF system Fe-S cluster assembly regulator [Natronospira proteinivora]MCP1726765.1 FeS assembly SUF system regulator [Natronospira proteinivora]
MLRLSKLTDYATVVLAHLARHPEMRHSAADVAQRTGLGSPTVSKVLKALARGGLVTSTRGAAGGYALARHATDISAADIIDAIEGPVAVTECSHEDGDCSLESICGVGQGWQKINNVIRNTLTEITLDELIRPEFPLRWFPSRPEANDDRQQDA